MNNQFYGNQMNTNNQYIINNNGMNLNINQNMIYNNGMKNQMNPVISNKINNSNNQQIINPYYQNINRIQIQNNYQQIANSSTKGKRKIYIIN